MDPSRGTPIDLAERRLHFLDARQRVLSQNLANADTPNYRPRDLPDFSRLVTRGNPGAMARTDARHLAPRGGDPRATVDRLADAAAPNGNAVSLDREALKVADTDSAHALTMTLHRRWLGMFRTALGRQGG